MVTLETDGVGWFDRQQDWTCMVRVGQTQPRQRIVDKGTVSLEEHVLQPL